MCLNDDNNKKKDINLFIYIYSITVVTNRLLINYMKQFWKFFHSMHNINYCIKYDTELFYSWLLYQLITHVGK